MQVPTPDDGPAESIYLAFFGKYEPHPSRVRTAVRKAHEAKQFEHAIRLVEAALINGQSQPWMYEVLALTMEMAGRPAADIERVSLSMADFGTVSYDSLLQSAKYLGSFDAPEAALRMLRQAASIKPEREEAYLMALPIAEQGGNPADVIWASGGILAASWGPQAETARTRAKSVARVAVARLRRSSDAAERDLAEELSAALADAETPDIRITLQWNGAADLDLEVAEPQDTVCSFKQSETTGGGLLLGDGFGPSNSEETYLCPRGFTGEYEVRIQPASGTPTGGRATVTVSVRQRDGSVKTQRQTLAIGSDPVGFAFTLPAGRRQQPRDLSNVASVPARPVAGGRLPRVPDREPGQRAGAAAVAPIVRTVAEGSALSGSAVVSPDRRYVRLGMQPWFSTITDIQQFTFVGQGAAEAGQQGGANAGQAGPNAPAAGQ